MKIEGWVGGDAWFGSIISCMELKRRLGINLSFIVKGNTNYCPMKVLHAIHIARYPDKAAGKWVVMKATIAKVDLYIMAYGWSNRGIVYFFDL